MVLQEGMTDKEFAMVTFLAITVGIGMGVLLEAELSNFSDAKLLERGVIEYNVKTGELQYVEK